MERKTILEISRIVLDMFLIICIGIFIFQFYTADKIAKDIALFDEPNYLLTVYQNLTGYECLCGNNIIEPYSKCKIQLDKIERTNIPTYNLSAMLSD